MLSLNLPAFDAKIAARNGKNVIFDIIRRRYVALTPEEWVRQHFVHFLLAHKGYPQALMANEVQVQLNGTKKRCDTVLYRRDLTARMIVEYKAPEIEITQKGFRPDYPLQHGAESGLSDCQQRASALLLPHRLRAQQLYFSAGYTRVSKLMRSYQSSLISSHHIPCVICEWCSHCPHLSRMSPWRRRQCSISGRREG